MNYAVFADPADPDGQLLGYLLSSTRKPGEVVFGRHFRFTLSLDGESVLDSRGFTNSCIAVPTTTEAGAKLPQGASSVGVTISHLLDPVPQETHVFASLSQGLPVYVIMSPSGTIYEVDGDKINKKAR